MSNIASIDIATVNFPGKISIDVYFSGCDMEPKCNGCHNKQLWDKNYGEVYSDEKLFTTIDKIINDLLSFTSIDFIGIAYMGGEPLAPYNRNTLKYLTAMLNKKYKIKQLIFTGRTLDEIEKQSLTSYIIYADYIKVGKFDGGKRTTGEFLASENQKLLTIGDLNGD